MAPKENDDAIELHSCQICRVRVTSSGSEHECSEGHRAAAQLAAAALARLRAHLAPGGAPDAAPTEVTELWDRLRTCLDEHGDATHTTDTPNTQNVQFCGSCAATFPALERATHQRSRGHLKAALEEQILEELVREYVDEEDLALLEPSKDERERLSVAANDAIKKYTCHMCATKIPEIYRDEHADSSRHRSCVALATAAARRTGAFLLKTTTDLPLKENDNITALLNAYTGFQSAESEGKKSESVPKTVKKRLTSKEYFTSIVPFLQYVGTFCTFIIDDTEYVTIKTASDTLRVHVVNFNGLYSGEQESGQLKCKLCNGVQDVTYSSLGDRDKLHVMTLGHIKQVLKPIDNVHGIRKLTEHTALCVLCNVYLSSHYVKNHVMNDIQHTAMLTEALERGKAFKESEKDLKIVIYSPVKNDNVQHNPPGFGYHPQGLNFGQPDQNFSSPRNNSLFGSTPAKQARQYDSFPRNSATFGIASTQSTGFGQSNQNTSTAFGGFSGQSANVQTNQPSGRLFSVQSNQNSIPQNSSAFGIASTQQTDSTQNQNNSFPQSFSFGTSNQPTGFGVPNQSVPLPNQSSPV